MHDIGATVAVIPTSATRSSLVSVVETLLRTDGIDAVVVAANGPGAQDRAAETFDRHTSVHVTEVRPGYSTARNEAIDHVMDRGARMVLLVDDDVTLPATALSAWLRLIGDEPDALVGLPVDRYSERASGLFDQIFANRGWPAAAHVDFLPATCLAVPATVWRAHRFNPALDSSGAEDTEFTWRCARDGTALLVVRPERGIEIHPADRLTARDLLMRVIVSTFVLRALRAERQLRLREDSAPPTRSLPMSLTVGALGLVSRLAPRAALTGARVVGVLLWRGRSLPVRCGASWRVRPVR